MTRTNQKVADQQLMVHRFNAGALALGIFVLYSFYSYFQWKHHITPSWDLGIFTQLAQSYASLNLPPIVPIKGPGFNLWGDHFHPILLLLGPVYALFPSPLTLLIVQNFLVALSVYLLVRFAQQFLGTWLALPLGLAYGLSFGIQQAVEAQFHEVAFALPFLVLSLGHLVTARVKESQSHLVKTVLWALPLVLVKEDMGMTVLMIGFVVFLRSQWLGEGKELLFPKIQDAAPSWAARFSATWDSLGQNRAASSGLLAMVFGLLASALAVAVILPAFNTGGVFDYADKVDLPGAIADPLQSLALMFYPWQKSITLGLLLLAGVLVWICSPLALVALPTIAWRFLSPQEGYWEPTWHYSLVLMPVVFLALLDVVAGAQKASQQGDTRRNAAGEMLRLVKTNAPRVVPVLALVVALVMLPQQPLSSLTDQNFATSTQSASDQMKEKAVRAVPAGVSVASDLSVLTYLIPGREVYWIGHQGEPAPDYVVIDRAGTAWGGNPPADPAGYASERYEGPYTLQEQIGSIYIVKKDF